MESNKDIKKDESYTMNAIEVNAFQSVFIKVENQVEADANEADIYQVKPEPEDKEIDDLLEIHYDCAEIKQELTLDGIGAYICQMDDTSESNLIHNNQPLKIKEYSGMTDDCSRSSGSLLIVNDDSCEVQMDVKNTSVATDKEYHLSDSCSAIRNNNRTTNNGGRPYHCSVCSKPFASEFLLKKHSKIHTPSYLCSVCGRIFSHPHNFKIHMRVHTGEKPYQCKICERTFSRLDHLTSHTATHTGKRPFECKVCNKTFVRSTHLNRHRKSHTGEKPYHCTVCEKLFSNVQHLKRHKAVHHTY